MSAMNPLDPFGGSTPVIERMLGNAYDTVRFVAANMDQIKGVNDNMEDIKEAVQLKDDVTEMVQEVEVYKAQSEQFAGAANSSAVDAASSASAAAAHEQVSGQNAGIATQMKAAAELSSQAAAVSEINARNHADSAVVSAEASKAASTAKPFTSLALLNASTPPVDPQAWAVVTNDTVANNGYYSWATNAWVRSVFQPALSVVADRVSFFISGRTTKNVAGSNSSRILSTQELVITGGLVFGASLRVAPVTDLEIPTGEALFVNLAGTPNGSGQLVPEVTSGGYTSGMYTNGRFIRDRNILLFINSTGSRFGGILMNQSITSEGDLDVALTNRSTRPTWDVLGRVDSFRQEGSAMRVKTTQLRVNFGSGRGTLAINAIDASVPAGQALYVDLDGPRDAGNRLTAAITDSGYSSGSNTGIPNQDGFVNDRRIYLLINDGGSGYGGKLAGSLNGLNNMASPAWMQAPSTTVSFDSATRTLTWTDILYLPVGNGQRVALAAGSHQIASGASFAAIYLDMNEASVASGTSTPATAVKSANYFEEAGRPIGNRSAIPMLVYQNVNTWRAAPGFVPVIGSGSAQVSSLAEDDLVIKTSLGALSIFVKGTKKGSTKYIEQTYIRQTRPFDPTGADLYGNQDVWRLASAYEVALTDISTLSFTRGVTILNGGELECAISIEGSSDYVGGWHGDELLSTAGFLLDGVAVNTSVTSTLIGKKLTLTQASTLYQWNTQTPVASRNKRLDISWDDGMRVLMNQYIKWSTVQSVRAAMLTMLPIVRRVGSSPTGALITDSAIRGPLWDVENIADAGFPEKMSPRELPKATIWSEVSGISAEAEVLRKIPGVSNYQFYISNSANYNKFYYSFAGMLSTPLNHVTSVNEVWDVESVIKLNTVN